MNIIAQGVKWTGVNGMTTLHITDREGKEVCIIFDRKWASHMPQLAIEACLQADISEPDMAPPVEPKHD